MVILVTGVSGSGKSTLGSALAGALGWAFVEGDRYHPRANIEKMSRGEPLDDADRGPWLAALGAEIDRVLASGEDAVVACSCLKRVYRERLVRGRGAAEIAVVHLRADPGVIRERMLRRTHYMKAEMLDSQLAILEPPGEGEAVVVEMSAPVEEALAEVRRRLGV